MLYLISIYLNSSNSGIRVDTVHAPIEFEESLDERTLRFLKLTLEEIEMYAFTAYAGLLEFQNCRPKSSVKTS
jgi:hypothetical protein